MPDIFISFSSADERLARFLHEHLVEEKIDAFLANVSVKPGEKWSPAIINALKASNWVLFLASRAACASPWVQQELGGALVMNKKVLPVIWDIPPKDLPGWIQQFQALNLAGATVEDARLRMTEIANQIKSDKTQGLVAVGLLLAALLAFGSK
jgi:hypothetical protein